MKFKFSFLCFAILLICNISFAETIHVAEDALSSPSHFIYYKGEKIYLISDSTRYSIISKKTNNISSGSNTMQIFSSNPDFLKTLDDVSYNINTFKVPNSNMSYSTRATNNSNNIILPCFKTSSGKELILTNYINIKLKSESDSLILNKITNEYSLEIIEQNSYMPLWYTLSITELTQKIR